MEEKRVASQPNQGRQQDVDPYKYYESLDPEQKEFIQRVAATIEGRIRKNTGDIDRLDEELAKRIAIELHIVSKASDYVMNLSRLIQSPADEERSVEREAALLDDLRKRDKAIVKMLRDLGTLGDPESEKGNESALPELNGGQADLQSAALPG